MPSKNKIILEKALPMIVALDKETQNKDLFFDYEKGKFVWLDVESPKLGITLGEKMRAEAGEDYDPFSPGLGSQILSKYLKEE